MVTEGLRPHEPLERGIIEVVQWHTALVHHHILEGQCVGILASHVHSNDASSFVVNDRGSLLEEILTGGRRVLVTVEGAQEAVIGGLVSGRFGVAT